MKTVIHQLKTMQKPLDGMSYVIQCSDSSVVVVDGGMDKGDPEKLIGFLKKITGLQTPTVAAWFITHNHADHTYCFMDFAERLTDSLIVKKLVYSFMPEWFYLNAEPACVPEKKRFEAAADRIPGLERVTPHAGDVYSFGDTLFEILYTAEDTPIVNEGRGMTVNDSSLVFRVRAEGQTVMFLGDIEKGGNGVMIKRYGRSLKSDVCQVAHHGFVSSTAEFYDLVDPEILLWPISMRNLKVYCPKIEVDRHLVKEMSVNDVYLAANGDVSLEMPIKVREEPYLPKIF
ncbi:MAG: MBL fold metallo-hydrolase, partial [Clostridia bacterium]|nr:MBL fold metallo-hydrolase [Clostridia bacterium]